MKKVDILTKERLAAKELYNGTQFGSDAFNARFSCIHRPEHDDYILFDGGPVTFGEVKRVSLSKVFRNNNN